MKTLAVLATLVGLAISAPAPQNDFQPNGLPQPGFQSLETSAAIHPIDFNTEIDGPVVSARSHLGFKNPVIVKKKTGYHVYRDSTEERADANPGESCGKQVRVKLCDDAAKSTDLRRSTKTEKLVAPKDDVEDSIKLAKEAVESLQRDLKTIDHETSGKSAQWKHGETDKDLHEDIEAARQALEHAQKNFGNLESMNLRATTLRDNEALLDISKAKTEEERMAQWKLAIENIQRNVEIARNIEDSFKAAQDHSSFLTDDAIDTTKFMRSDNQENKADHKVTKETISASSSRMSLEENTNKKMQESEHHKITEKKAEQFGEDMKSAASESVQLKHEHHGEQNQNTKATQAKLAEVSLNLNTPLTQNPHNDKPLTKEVGSKVDASLRNAHNENKMFTHDESMATSMMHSDSARKVSLNNEMTSRTSENVHHQFSKHEVESSNTKKTFESHSLQGNEHKAMQHGKSVANEWESKIADKNLKHEKSAWTEAEQKDMMLKSAELNHGQNDKTVNEHSTSGISMKSAEHSTEHKTHNHDAEQFVKKSGLSVHSDMKLADNMELASDINLKAPLNVHLNSGVNLNTEKSKEGKSVEQAKELDLEHARVVGYHKLGHHEHGYIEHGHHGHQGHFGHGHGHFEHGHGHLEHGHGHFEHGHGHGIHGHGFHGKAAEFDSAMHPSMQMEMKDFSEKSAMENMLQWKHHHDARSSYGAGAYGGSGVGVAGAYGGGSAGAVGVFPHAKVGGCGIPLLLSCSPSVVSGSLAKSHGYAAPAPAYRNGEESKLKNKRDIIKTKEMSLKKVKDSAKTNNTNLEKKI